MKRNDFSAIVMVMLTSSIGLLSGPLEAQQAAVPQTPAPPAVAPLPTISVIQDPTNPFSNDPLRDQQRSELAELDQRTHKIAAELRAKPDAAKEQELKKLIEDYFDKRHAVQVAEMKALTEKLAKMQELLKKREQKKEEILARRIKQLLGESDDLDWEPTSPRNYQNYLNYTVPRVPGSSSLQTR